MRQLKSTDLFRGLRVCKELGIKQEMKDFAQAFSEGRISAKNQQEIGAELIFGILSNAGSEGAEKAIFAFLSEPMEIPVEELRDMDLIVFAEKIKELIAFIDIEAWRAFFSSMAEMLKSQK